MNALLTAIEQRPGAAFAVFLALHFVVWTALPAALYPNLPLDLIEALTYGREWQLGYDKLPPLPWWLVEITYRVFGPDLFYYVLAQSVVVAAFALVWKTARPLVGPVGALVSLLIVDGLHYLHFTAAKFNHDVIQLPFWALAGYSFHAALRRGRLLHWALLGLAIGMALWAKYFVAMLIVPLVLFALIDPQARRHFATPGPYLAILVAFVIASPHLIWLVQNDFLPFRYADVRAAPSRGLFDHIWHPLQFVIGQLFFLLPALAIALPLFLPRADRKPPAADAFDRRIITLLVFGPAATVAALSLVTGRGTIAMWGYPLWLFLGLWIVLNAPVLARQPLARVVATWAIVFFAFAAIFVASYAVMPRFDGRYRAVFFPGDRLAVELSNRFRTMTGKPLAYVIATMWTGGNVAHYAPEHPRVVIDGSPRRAPWIDLGDLRARGAIVVWTDGDPRVLPVAYRNLASDAEIQEPFLLPYRWFKGQVLVGWAVLRPRPPVAMLNSPRG
ncbi:MAG TPA: glycosyltransferase family 39 protein [Xanthobacteraceae bacterium]|nr:glycosyltransferase family 39 protein [Xanthobacteraceae bacterium]